MKHLVLCLSLSALFISRLDAQHSLPSPRLSVENQMGQYTVGQNYIGLSQSRLHFPITFASTHQRPYMQALARLMSLESSSLRLISEFIEQYPSSMDRERARLMLALVYLDTNDYISAAHHLSLVRAEGLNDEEYSQCLTLRAYLMLTQSGSGSTREARTLLEQASTGQSIWAERAILYLCSLDWNDGQAGRAKALLEDHPWSPQLAPEAVYLQALMAYETESPSKAIARTQELQRRFPQLIQRIRLQGAMGQAYYALGDYTNAIRILSPLELSKLTSEEAFALGAAYYHRAQKQGDGTIGLSIPALQRATLDQGERGAIAQFALANAYRADGQDGQAQLALSAIMEHPQSPNKMQEEALYQLIEIGFSRGYDAFGSQIRQTERFLADYPNSRYRNRVMELLRGYFSIGKDYQTKLDFIKRLELQGEKLNEAKQDVLVRLASTQDPDSDTYLATLNEAIALSNKSEAYGIARVMRSAYHLREGKYKEAEQDAAVAMRLQQGASAYENGIASYLHGYALYNQKRYSEAYKSLDRYASSGAMPQMRADALCRMGDCLLGQGGLQQEAMACYLRADRLHPQGSDEALYRVSSIHRQRGEYDKQIEVIDRLLDQHPQSIYTADVLYDKGRALLIGRKQAVAADEIFTLLEQRFPSSPSAPLAALERALIQSNKGDEQKAIEAYKRVVSTYPESSEAQIALSDLKSLYAENNRLDEYAAFVSSLGGKLTPDAQDAVHLKYLALESRMRRGEANVEQELLAFVHEYPDSPDRYRAEWLLINRYVQAERRDEALVRLKELSTLPLSLEQELRVEIQVGEIHRSLGNGAEAVRAYQKAYQLSHGSVETSLELGQKLTETALEANQFTLATETARALLQRKQLPVETMQSLTLLLGKAQEGNKAIKTAINTYASLSAYPDTPSGAEAMVRRATLMLRLGQAKETQEMLEKFVTTGTPQQYWLARAFVLLADSCEAVGDLYLAQQYIQSLKDNYQEPATDIREMIEDRLTKYSQK
ncbi:MAG: tetratricopeptide repeat protein [Porphyromonadaceae bacterium]|nr:tetratricopeptide repeat protein [Porphyromonadaceae bacterium]